MGGWLLPTRLTSCVCCLALLMFSPFHSARMARRSISDFGRFVSIAALCVHRCTRRTFRGFNGSLAGFERFVLELTSRAVSAVAL